MIWERFVFGEVSCALAGMLSHRISGEPGKVGLFGPGAPTRWRRCCPIGSQQFRQVFLVPQAGAHSGEVKVGGRLTHTGKCGASRPPSPHCSGAGTMTLPPDRPPRVALGPKPVWSFGSGRDASLAGHSTRCHPRPPLPLDGEGAGSEGILKGGQRRMTWVPG